MAAKTQPVTDARPDDVAQGNVEPVSLSEALEVIAELRAALAAAQTTPTQAPDPRSQVAIFIEDMLAAGYELQAHKGPSGWYGPAVYVADKAATDQVDAATELVLQRQTIRGGWAVFPKEGDLAWYVQNRKEG